ncbi:MAG: pyridoxal phosphate-dependent aminotransferase [bacterium]|nr:pyridoxal phosphate-dependent aminotransferase [bacterium]
MEWAKTTHTVPGSSLSRSAVPLISSLTEIPGGPFEVRLAGPNAFYGHPGLRARIAQLYDASPEEVLIAQGASQANYLIAGALLEHGGRGHRRNSVYEPVMRGIEMLAEKIVRLPRRDSANFLPDPLELRSLLNTQVKLVWLTNLHNPTQREIEPQLVRALADECDKVGATLVIDEVYLPFVRPDHRSHGFTHGAISVNSLDKTWGLDNLRVGWAVGPAKVMERAYRFNNLMGVQQPFVTEDIADQILRSEPAFAWLKLRRETACGQLSMLHTFLKVATSVQMIPPSGGVNACLKLPDSTDDREFVKQLAEEKRVRVFPGSLFELPGCIRVSVGCDPVETRKHLSLLGEMLREYA